MDLSDEFSFIKTYEAEDKSARLYDANGKVIFNSREIINIQQQRQYYPIEDLHFTVH